MVELSLFFMVGIALGHGYACHLYPDCNHAPPDHVQAAKTEKMSNDINTSYIYDREKNRVIEYDEELIK